MIELTELAQHILVISVTIGLMGLLLIDKIKPAYIFFGAVLIFLLAGIIDIKDFLDAFSNQSVLSIFLLIFITFGVRTNFNILAWMDKIFGNAKSGRSFTFKMSGTVAFFSSFLNNTPIVALFLPYVYQWSKKHDISPSKILISVSYAAMAGGMLTVIGTSTNLILKGLVVAEGGTPPGFLDYLLPGLLVAILTVIYLPTIGYAILPNKSELINSVNKKQREYLVEVQLAKESDLVGKMVSDIEIKDDEGINLLEIERYGMRISPVRSYEKLRQNDTLIFAGDSEKIIELLRDEENFVIPILQQEKEKAEEKERHSNEDKKSEQKREDKKEEDQKEEADRSIVETVIPINSALVGRTLNNLNFKNRYDAVVIGIHRNGATLKKKIDRIKLRPGDLLMIVPGENFQKNTHQQDDLYVMSVVTNLNRSSSLARKGFVAVLAATIAAMAFAGMDLFFALLIITSYMVATKMMSVEDLKTQFSVNLFVVLVASLAFSTALINSGVAEMAANAFMNVFESMGNEGIVIGIYVVTLILASFVTHAAAVAIVFPIAFSIGSGIEDLDMVAVYIAIAFAASASFHTPFSYQTNMMVYGPGGYKFSDFLKTGTPLTLLYSALVIAFILFYYSF